MVVGEGGEAILAVVGKVVRMRESKAWGEREISGVIGIPSYFSMAEAVFDVERVVAGLWRR